MWDKIERSERLSMIPKLARLAESLPTSSATIEQSFSNIKLIKTDLRNRLGELSLEGLILVGQEFRSEKKIIIEEPMLSLYKNVCSGFYKKKVVKSTKIIKETKNLTQNKDLKPIEEEFNIMTNIANCEAMRAQNQENNEDNLGESEDYLYSFKRRQRHNKDFIICFVDSGMSNFNHLISF